MIMPEELEHVAFLNNLGAAYLNQVAMLARLVEVAPGEVLFHEGQESALVYFVLSGTVSLEVAQSDGTAAAIALASTGDLLGWSPVLGRGVMTATARAGTRCRLAVIEAKALLALCERDPHFAVAFLRQVGLVLSDRLRETRRQLAEVQRGGKTRL